MSGESQTFDRKTFRYAKGERQSRRHLLIKTPGRTD